MRVQLSRYFEPINTSAEPLRQTPKPSKRSKKGRTLEPEQQQIQFVDPLKSSISFYKKCFSKSNDFSEGRAFKSMKDYIVHQDRFLKQVRLQNKRESRERRVRTEIEEPSISSSQAMAEIPEAGSYFRDQKRDRLVYENRKLRSEISEKISFLEGSVRKYEPMRVEVGGDKQAQDIIDINEKLEKDKSRNNRLFVKLERQKKRIKQIFSTKKQPQSYLDQPIKLDEPRSPNKKKVILKGLRSVSLKVNQQTRKLSPSVALLFQLRNFSELKQKKEGELNSMLKHQLHNRSYTLKEKDSYYTKSMSNSTITPSVQFKTRKLMDDRLIHRLKATKDQATNFKQLLKKLKEDRVIVCKSLQDVFDDLREMVLSGRILKEEDLQEVLEKYQDDQDLKTASNVAILKKVKRMMI